MQKESRMSETMEARSDALCLIPWTLLATETHYSNPAEYLLRPMPGREAFLRRAGADAEMAAGRCSDFDLWRTFFGAVRAKEADGEEESIVTLFRRALERLCRQPWEALRAMSAEGLWQLAYEKLAQTDAAVLAGDTSATSVGFCLYPGQNTEAFALPGVSHAFVRCPLGGADDRLDRWIPTHFASAGSWAAFESRLMDFSLGGGAIALFLHEFVFETPNAYAAAKAFEKQGAGAALSYKEQALLQSQLYRNVFAAAAEAGREVFLFYPGFADYRGLCSAEAWLDYWDETGKREVSLALFGSDAPSLSLIAAQCGKAYKNSKVLPGVVGQDLVTEAKRWGMGDRLQKASLARTPALLF